MRIYSLLCWLLLLWLPASQAVIPDNTASSPAVRSVTSGDVMSWLFGLMIVLAVFFLCVWAMRKLGGLNVGGTEQMRLLGGLSLGMRERVVLLQVGKKQLVLGVTPGRIEALLVLEGDACLQRGEGLSAPNMSGFAQKLSQAFKGETDA